ncbi:hypothetical protein Asulf_00957 [Archaeoglobus sulfaticallidus PM70-1]|uniref:Uncharacterized protein n=1 Tax=Archaeoglobus sulfaticallidus PM70-1 TaxID=387631 RepID=N0BKD7_9EURY|nr:hypothetical protein [Archaeoglobus sulfaticallidus]AGK60961.1 hypothetical protein Asulf_00957 [Archaeoglobus sulfaticallidus PM70-1]
MSSRKRKHLKRGFVIALFVLFLLILALKVQNEETTCGYVEPREFSLKISLGSHYVQKLKVHAEKECKIMAILYPKDAAIVYFHDVHGKEIETVPAGNTTVHIHIIPKQIGNLSIWVQLISGADE